MIDSDLFKRAALDFQQFSSGETISLEEYLDRCKSDPMVYASPSQRMLRAIGDPQFVDTSKDTRLSRIFGSKVIKRYPAFEEFYGMEETIDGIVSYFKHSAQGLEESKQILYLLGPVGGGKSTMAEKLKALMEVEPVYVIEGSPVFENPLGLFYPREKYVKILEDEYKIPGTALRTVPSPWALEKMKEVRGDLKKFRVRKIFPSRLSQACIARIEPGDENNQDISTLVGEIDIREIDKYPQNHPYAYSFSGGLNRGNRGMVEMVEMFKTPIKMLHPLLTATQDRMYIGTKAIGSIPFDGIIIAHSNESEWMQFKNNRTNEAFLDRVYLVKVPYCVRVNEEIEIYKKLLRNSELADAPCAPGTLELLAQFCVMSRLKEHENSTLYSKMRVYNGENIKNDDPKAKPMQEYQEEAGVNEGMEGLSPRLAFKALSKTYNLITEEIGANPYHMMYVLKTQVAEEQFDEAKEEKLLEMLDGVLMEKYLEHLEKDIRASYLDSFSELCQNVFETYFYYADAWIDDKNFRDPDTKVLFDREQLNNELEKIEKPAGIDNPKDFRNDATRFVVRYRADNGGKMPRWNEFEKMRMVIEKKVLKTTDEILPVISFSPKRSPEEQRKHDQFITKMKERGYTERMTRLLCEWFMRMRRLA